MDISIEDLLDYVFENLIKDRQKEIDNIIKKDSFYAHIIYELRNLKKILLKKEKVMKFLEEQEDIAWENLFQVKINNFIQVDEKKLNNNETL